MQQLEGAQAVVWLLGTLIVAGMVAATAVRVVPDHERLVLSRFGRVLRVAGPGLVGRVPVIDQWREVSLLPVRMQTAVAVVSADGVPVHLQVGAVYRVVEPTLSPLAGPDPHLEVQQALESLVAREVSRAEVSELLGLRLGLETELADELGSAAESFGIEVDEVEIRDIEVRLTMSLIESLRRRSVGGT